MQFGWFKQYVPRGIYARAALIIVLPVVVVQLAVSVVFIRRHLEDVTSQMTSTLVRELDVIAGFAAAADSRDEAMDAMQPILVTLHINARFVRRADIPSRDRIRWYDYSGRVVRATLRNDLPDVLAVIQPDDRVVHLFVDSDLGPVQISFNRRRVSAAAPHQLFVTMLFFGGVMTLIAYVYMRNQLRPIKKLAEAAEAFGRGRSVPYAARGALEVRTAGNAFLDMRNRIERQIEQRTMMLSGVSHDLRTPLTRLRLGLSLIDEDDAGPMLRDVDEMQALLDAFLDFARGAAEGDPERIDPISLARSVVEDAQRLGRPVSLATVEGTGTVNLRPVALRRALENLIGNAVRYGTRAEVSVTLTEKSLRFRVEDDGPGIAAEDRAEAVRPFSRLDPARNQDKGSGVGLGLAIVSDIARAHGGVLRLGTSDRLGGLMADIVIGR
ncbi:ATP-binding protein [Pukyongiella litopenaei]|uniref:histidine kinase n=1 Tax=Pukyongiella litopenaei TaxID=2605946 RepID=A0A2S0MKY6_9RHOB|nr:ATP-binding protein [Pukyongiella litopenaei]AVO36548.1 HAMP domain-containing protein [Pukyongiella litopenaei]